MIGFIFECYGLLESVQKVAFTFFSIIPALFCTFGVFALDVVNRTQRVFIVNSTEECYGSLESV